MKNLVEIYARCTNMLDDIGIEYGTIFNVTINTRAKRRWGLCHKIADGIFKIEISSRLMEDDIDMKQVEDTLIHELLHTCKGCMNHGAEWKKLADKVNRAYGYNIKRTASYAEVGISESERESFAKHKFTCCRCGKSILRQRESKFTKNWQRYHCGICGGSFKKDF